MKSTHRIACSSFVLAWALALPAGAASYDQDTDAGAGQAKSAAEMHRPDGSVERQDRGNSPDTGAAAGSLAGSDVINDAGERIGTIDKVVRDPSSGELYAVISVGGFLDIGDQDIAVKLSELQRDGEWVKAMGGASAAELEQQTAYQESRYQAVPEGMAVSLGSKKSQDRMADSRDKSFGDLDDDGNGYLSRDEAKDYEHLDRKWTWADQNADSQLDKSEFSAFEELGIREDPQGERAGSESGMDKGEQQY